MINWKKGRKGERKKERKEGRREGERKERGKESEFIDADRTSQYYT